MHNSSNAPLHHNTNIALPSLLFESRGRTDNLSYIATLHCWIQQATPKRFPDIRLMQCTCCLADVCIKMSKGDRRQAGACCPVVNMKTEVHSNVCLPLALPAIYGLCLLGDKTYSTTTEFLLTESACTSVCRMILNEQQL